MKVTEILYRACFSNKLVAELSYLCEMYTDGPFLDKVTLKNTTWVFRLRKTSFEGWITKPKTSLTLSGLTPTLSSTGNEFESIWTGLLMIGTNGENVNDWGHKKTDFVIFVARFSKAARAQSEAVRKAALELVRTRIMMLDAWVEVDIGRRWWCNLLSKQTEHIFVCLYDQAFKLDNTSEDRGRCMAFEIFHRNTKRLTHCKF